MKKTLQKVLKGIQLVFKEYLETLKEMGKFIEICKPSKSNQEDIDNLNIFIRNSKTEVIIDFQSRIAQD